MRESHRSQMSRRSLRGVPSISARACSAATGPRGPGQELRRLATARGLLVLALVGTRPSPRLRGARGLGLARCLAGFRGGPGVILVVLAAGGTPRPGLVDRDRLLALRTASIGGGLDARLKGGHEVDELRSLLMR